MSNYNSVQGSTSSYAPSNGLSLYDGNDKAVAPALFSKAMSLKANLNKGFNMVLWCTVGDKTLRVKGITCPLITAPTGTPSRAVQIALKGRKQTRTISTDIVVATAKAKGNAAKVKAMKPLEELRLEIGVTAADGTVLAKPSSYVNTATEETHDFSNGDAKSQYSAKGDQTPKAMVTWFLNGVYLGFQFVADSDLDVTVLYSKATAIHGRLAMSAEVKAWLDAKV